MPDSENYEVRQLRVRLKAVMEVLFEYTYYSDGEKIIDPLAANPEAADLRGKCWAALQAEPKCEHDGVEPNWLAS